MKRKCFLAMYYMLSHNIKISEKDIPLIMKEYNLTAEQVKIQIQKATKKRG